MSSGKRNIFKFVTARILRIHAMNILVKFIYFSLYSKFCTFSDSNNYWKKRYERGGNSGPGSYEKLAAFKASVVNEAIAEHHIHSAIEFGCGDGNQLTLMNYPVYTGFDISPDAISSCQRLFPDSSTRTFRLMTAYAGETADLTLSLDVIFHLVEDEVFHSYMHLLFAASTRLVIIYSSNTENQARFQSRHVKHREFTVWIKTHAPNWQQTRFIQNAHPYNGVEGDGSFSDFYFFERIYSA